MLTVMGSDGRDVRTLKASAFVVAGLVAGLLATAGGALAAGAVPTQPSVTATQQGTNVDDVIIAQLKAQVASQNTQIEALKTQISTLNSKVQDLEDKSAATKVLQLSPAANQWQYVPVATSSVPLSASGTDANDITYSSPANADGMNQYNASDTSALQTEGLLGGTGSLGLGSGSSSHSTSSAITKKQTSQTTPTTTGATSNQTTSTQSGSSATTAARIRRAFATSSPKAGVTLTASKSHVGAVGAKLGLTARSFGKLAKH